MEEFIKSAPTEELVDAFSKIWNQVELLNAEGLYHNDLHIGKEIRPCIIDWGSADEEPFNTKLTQDKFRYINLLLQLPIVKKL